MPTILVLAVNPAAKPEISGEQVLGWGCCAVVVIVVLLALGAAFGSPGRCGICDDLIKRKHYTWKIDGKKTRVCPNCNRGMERRKSRDALNRKFGP